jgi:hypothetical protein
MLLVGFFSWWYGAGWRDQISRISQSIDRLNDYFSVPLLLKTFFKPFREISSGESGKGLQQMFQVFLDKLFSRAIGAFMRFFMIIFGLFAMLFAMLFGLIRLIIWPLFPLLPLVGVVLMFTIGTPWKI